MDYDAIVVGAGPGGASATFFLGQRERRVLVLERATLPRHKPCGGAVPKAAFRRFPFSFDPVIEAEPTTAEFHYPGQLPVKMLLDDCPIVMVRRQAFDHYIVVQASDGKVEVLDGVAVTDVVEHSDSVEVTTADGRTFAARYLIAADGTNSTVARVLGLRKRRVLGGTLEAEVKPGETTLTRWGQTAVLQFDACPGGYLWIFPKRRCLSVGIARLSPGKVDLQSILMRQMANFGVDLTGVRLHGHPLPLHRKSERLHTARCLLVGDAAGLVDPLLGEGIRFAMQSAEIAAQAIVQDDLAGYTRRVQREIGNDQLWAKKAARILHGFPYFSWRWGICNSRMGQAMLDVLRERLHYRTFVWRLPLYFLESLLRYPFARSKG